MPGAAAFVLKGYPRLSETFIAQEILALERRGLDVLIVSLRRPTDRTVHPIHREIAARALYLPEYLYREPARVLRAWRAVRRSDAYRRARAVWWRDLRRDPTANRVRRFGQALVLAHELDPRYRHLHAHFLHTPASVARYTAILRRLPLSISAHAKDVWTIPEWEKREKIAAAEWLVTCSAVNRDHLATLGDGAKIGLVYHGLDFSRFPPPSAPRPPRDGRDRNDPAIVLTVGRAVEKKGIGDVLAALAALPPEFHWRYVHVGGGELGHALKAQARALGIESRIVWRGALAHEAVLNEYRAADLFVLASRIAKNGDRDGLPNVLMEAQSQGLACIATDLSGIPELIEDGATGLLVAPGDALALSREIADLIADWRARERLGAAGAKRVREHFAMERGVAALTERFGLGARAAAE
ncbi:MAG TPA: glycosyltransferase family 4 protein [Alphaproteobacteria bacterium]|nr:glycosyltransferase family 4 protein [Alphaproteobacteria bacterium]